MSYRDLQRVAEQYLPNDDAIETADQQMRFVEVKALIEIAGNLDSIAYCMREMRDMLKDQLPAKKVDTGRQPMGGRR